MSKLEPIAFDVQSPSMYDDNRLGMLTTLADDPAFSEFLSTIAEDTVIFEAVRDETYSHDQLMEARALAKYARHLMDRVNASAEAAKIRANEQNEQAETTHNTGPRI
jgi:hypothetical protein